MLLVIIMSSVPIEKRPKVSKNCLPLPAVLLKRETILAALLFGSYRKLAEIDI